MTRKKILPEDLIQGTNIQQHNYMIGAINDIDERQSVVEGINAATTAEVATLKNDVVLLDNKKYDKTDGIALEQEFAKFPAEVQSMIVDSFDTHLKDVLVDDDMLRFSADQKAIFLQKNRRDGTTVDEQIPLSTRQNVGLATPEDLLTIDELTSRVTTLENSGITGELFYLDHDFSGITDAVRTVHFNADIGKPPVTGDSVVDSQQRSWRYVITGPTTFGWVEVPHLSIGGDLKAVKSSNDDGKIYVENDNTCSVVGWNDVKNDIAGHAGNTSNPHGVTKAQVGLGNVDNTADVNKPISTATQTALDTKQDMLAFDDAPVAGSDNPVKSRGIYDALMEIESRLPTPEVLDKLITMTLPAIDCTKLSTMYKDDTSLTETPLINATRCTSMYEVFKGCSNLKTVKYIHTPNVTSMNSMFYGCSSVVSIPEMDTSIVTDMGGMFNGCSSLRTVPEMDTSKVTSMSYMFYGCSSLTSVPEMDTSKVTDMSYMFQNCSSLTTAPPLDVSRVTKMLFVFEGCTSLTSVTFTGNVVPPYSGTIPSETPIAAGNGSIYVPDDMVDAYKAASGWSARASVIKGISEKP